MDCLGAMIQVGEGLAGGRKGKKKMQMKILIMDYHSMKHGHAHNDGPGDGWVEMGLGT